MMLVLTRLTTLAAAYASPVSMVASPVEEAVFSPVAERTMTLLVTVASLLFHTLRELLLRHVRSVHWGVVVPGSVVGLDPAPPTKKYERSYSLRSIPWPKSWLRKRMRPSELKMLVLTSFMTLAVETALPVTIRLAPAPPITSFSPVIAVEVAALPRTPKLSAAAVKVDEFISCPGWSGFMLLVLRVLDTDVVAVASPVCIVPPVVVAVPPVPSSELSDTICGTSTVMETSSLSSPPVEPEAVTTKGYVPVAAPVVSHKNAPELVSIAAPLGSPLRP